MTWIEILVAGYAALYVLLTIGGVRMDLQEREPAFVIGLEIAVAVLALLGYGVYHVGYRDEVLTDMWKVMAPLLVLTEGGLLVRDLRDLRPETDLSPEEIVWLHTIGVWLAVLLLVPVHWFNLKLAYGS